MNCSARLFSFYFSLHPPFIKRELRIGRGREEGKLYWNEHWNRTGVVAHTKIRFQFLSNVNNNCQLEARAPAGTEKQNKFLINMCTTTVTDGAREYQWFLVLVAPWPISPFPETHINLLNEKFSNETSHSVIELELAWIAPSLLDAYFPIIKIDRWLILYAQLLGKRATMQISKGLIHGIAFRCVSACSLRGMQECECDAEEDNYCYLCCGNSEHQCMAAHHHNILRLVLGGKSKGSVEAPFPRFSRVSLYYVTLYTSIHPRGCNTASYDIHSRPNGERWEREACSRCRMHGAELEGLPCDDTDSARLCIGRFPAE